MGGKSYITGDNLLFYVSTTPRLWDQQEAEWLNIKFETRNLNYLKKSRPSADDFGESFIKN